MQLAVATPVDRPVRMRDRTSPAASLGPTPRRLHRRNWAAPQWHLQSLEQINNPDGEVSLEILSADRHLLNQCR